MYPSTHFLFPLAISLVLVLFGFFNYYQAILTAFLGAFVDIDHYLHRIIYNKDFSLKSCWNKAVAHIDKRERTIVHHEKGFIIITILIAILIIFSLKYATIVALAYYSHFFLDNLHIKLKKKFKLKKAGFKIQMPVYEIILNLILIILILAITLNI